MPISPKQPGICVKVAEALGHVGLLALPASHPAWVLGVLLQAPEHALPFGATPFPPCSA